MLDRIGLLTLQNKQYIVFNNAILKWFSNCGVPKTSRVDSLMSIKG